MIKKRCPNYIGMAGLCLLLASANAIATMQQRETNIVELVGKSELILRGTVKSVTDGIDASWLPLYGSNAFMSPRRFAARSEPSTPSASSGCSSRAAWATAWSISWSLRPAGPRMRRAKKQFCSSIGAPSTPVFRPPSAWPMENSRYPTAGASNDANNSGLFTHVKVEPNLLAGSDRQMMSIEKGPVDTKAFVSLVRKAVKGRWIEAGEHAQ